jgi:hypothetical protein
VGRQVLVLVAGAIAVGGGDEGDKLIAEVHATVVLAGILAEGIKDMGNFMSWWRLVSIVKEKVSNTTRRLCNDTFG